MTTPATPPPPAADRDAEPLVLALRVPAPRPDARAARPPRDLSPAEEMQRWLDLSA